MRIRGRKSLRALLVLVAGSVLAGALQGAPARAEETPAASRILLYGDSYTMGSSGDWTTRFRLWQHLTASGTAFDFVGPRNDVRGYMSGWFGSQAYRYAEFDRDHAAVAGMALTSPKWEVSTLAGDYQADVVVGMIGINDLIRGLATPEELAAEWRRQIALIRDANPDTDVVLVPYPTTWYAPIVEYNDYLVALGLELDTPKSRILVSPVADFDMARDTYDRAHPSAAGEKKLAAMLAGTLAELGLSSPDAAATTVSDPKTARWAPAVQVAVDGSTLAMTWPQTGYASAMDVVVQDVTAETWAGWKVIAVKRVREESWSLDVAAGRKYRVWLLPVKGYLRMGTQSPKVTVEVPS